MKVLLVCHGLAPGRGSEPGFGWSWSWYLSKEHDVWVLAHPQYRAEVDAYLTAHPNSRLHIIWLAATTWDPAKGMGGFQWHYFRWLKQAERIGRSLQAKESFDVVHHISLSTISAPPQWWKLGIPFVWGPLGGGQNCPPQLRGLFEGERWREWMRLVRLRLLHYYPPFRAAVRNSAAIFLTNSETLQFVESAGGRNLALLLDSGVADESLPAPPQLREQPETVRILWANTFEKRKALPLALEAVAHYDGTVPIKLVVAGSNETAAWAGRADALGISDGVEFVGRLPPDRMREEFGRADVFLFTSVRDSFGSVMLEAMSHGLPIVALDLHGVGAFVPTTAGVKVPVGSRGAIVRDLADALRLLAGDPRLRHAMGKEAWRFASMQLWTERATRMSLLYRRVAAQASPPPITAEAEPGRFQLP